MNNGLGKLPGLGDRRDTSYNNYPTGNKLFEF